MGFNYKEYRDPLYGFVSVSELEQEIIDTKYFQRLRNIKQLGTTFLIYPSAMHSRFEHSLGTLFVVDKWYDELVLNKNNLNELKWSSEEVEQYRILVRLAALLHDIGHSPFSHAAQELFPQKEGKTKYEHEDYTYKIITETEIKDTISKHMKEEEAAEKIAEMAIGLSKEKDLAFLSELLTGDFGADRIDYLTRDSYYLGVQYGKFDIHRLLNTMFVRYNDEKKGPELAVDDGGVHTIEGFLLARYFMFLDVYFHKTRRIMDKHLVEFLIEFLEGRCYPLDIRDYVLWDDTKVYQLLVEKRYLKSAKRLLDREHFRLSFETVDHPELHELGMFNWLLDKVKDRFDSNLIKDDDADKSPYSFNKPPFFVKHNNVYKSLKERSSLIRSLEKIFKRRIYADSSIRKDVGDFCENFWEREMKKIREAK